MSHVGLRIVLSKDFPRSDRDVHSRFMDVHSRFMDAMALVTRYGKPDFFVTMTCNPYLDEIVRIVIAWSNTARSSRYSSKGL